VCAYVKEDAWPGGLVDRQTCITIGSYMREECEHATLEYGIGIKWTAGVSVQALASPVEASGGPGRSYLPGAVAPLRGPAGRTACATPFPSGRDLPAATFF
jgi:hypothetical protein